MTLAGWDAGCVLVLGGRGMLGRAMVARLRERSGKRPDQVVSWDIQDLDIRDDATVHRAIGGLRPEVVVNAAGYTDVDGCETRVDEAMGVNAEAAGHVALACRDVEATLVHIGSDYIFDGRSTVPYAEGDAPNPLSVYGRSKWEGEQRVLAANGRCIIVRTQWMFGAGGRNFVDAILARARAGEPLRVVTDQVGCPTSAADVAEAVTRLLEAGVQGTFHFANAGQCSWHEFAREILRQADLERPVRPILSTALGRPAGRPAYSALDTSRYVNATGARPAPWPDALQRYLRTLEHQGVR